MKPKHSLTKVFIFLLSSVSLASIVLIGLIWIDSERTRSKQESRRITEDFYQSWEKFIRLETNRICDYIDIQTEASEIEFFKDIKVRVKEIWSMLDNLVQQHRQLMSDNENRDMLLALLGHLSINGRYDHFVVVDMDGNVIMPRGHGKGARGEYLGNLESEPLKEVIDSVKAIGEGFYRLDPLEHEVSSTQDIHYSYLKVFEPFGWIIGVSERFSSFEQNSQGELLSWVSEMPLPADNNLLIMTYDGQILRYSDDDMVGLNIFENDLGTDLGKVAPKIISEAKERSKDFLTFFITDPATGEKSECMGYFRAVPRWRWVVVNWVDLNNLDPVLAEQQSQLVETVRKQILRVVLISFTMLLVIFIISRFISAKASRSFSSFFNFFEKSSTASIELDPQEQHFAEFQLMAQAANEMIRQRRLAEKLLKESEEKFRTIYDVSPQIIAILNHDGRLTDVNEEFSRYSGCSVEEARGRYVSDFLFAQKEIKGKYLEELSRNGSINGLEVPCSLSDGRNVVFLFFGRWLQLAANRMALCVMVDITELKVAEAEKMQLQEKLSSYQKMEAMGVMATGVAHELNNILSGLIGYPELLLMDENLTDSQRSQIKEILESGHRAAAVVSDLLTISRGVAVNKVAMDLNEVVKRYLASTNFQAICQPIGDRFSVKTNLAKDGAWVQASEVHLAKVISNLVKNALSSLNPGSVNRLTIDTGVENVQDPDLVKRLHLQPGRYSWLEVADNGPGIPEEVLSQIFEPFNSLKSGLNDRGLEMTIVYNIVRDHNGAVEVNSSSEGSSFKLFFPMAKARHDKKLKKELEKYQGHGQLILVVDDVDIQRKLAQKMLKTLGYETMAVASGEEAVSLLRETEVDLLVLDMIMAPGINGRETFETVKSFKPKQKAIIASGMAEDEEVKKAQALGAREFISKPYSLDDMAEAVFKALNSN